MSCEAYAIKHVATGEQFTTSKRKAAWETAGFAKLAFYTHFGKRFDDQSEYVVVRLVEEK